MSPEQVRGEELDERTDLFSLGVVLYQMAAGIPPFRGNTSGVIFNEILTKTSVSVLRFNPDLPEALAHVIDKALEKDRSVRYQSAADLMTDLRRIQRDLDSDKNASLAATSPIPKKRRTWGWSKVATLVLLPLLAAALILYFGLTRWYRLPNEVERSIAVLPFENLSDNPENEYFSDGLTEDIITHLSGIQRLRVTPRASALRYADSEKSLQEIGHDLGVASILQGSVRRDGERVRITAQLVDVPSDRNLWAKTYDRQLTDIFTIQEEIAQNIAASLSLAVSPRERRGMGRGPVADVRAYDIYLRARSFFYSARKNTLRITQQMLRRAIELDPQYALAYAGLADTYSWRYLYWDHSEDSLEEAEKASQKAVELAPDLAEAHVSRGIAISLRGSHREAELHFEKAIELNPRLFEVYYFYAHSCFLQGQMEKAAELFERASEMRPDDYQAFALLATTYKGMGLQTESRTAQRRAIEIIENHLQRDPEDVRAVYLGAGALAASGETEKALQWAQRALEIESEEPAVAYNVANVYASAGKADEAIELLERATMSGSMWRKWMEKNPLLDPLREHPRFEKLLERLQ
jgi:TolB-like protein/Flp pilus assembly protein TadD